MTTKYWEFTIPQNSGHQRHHKNILIGDTRHKDILPRDDSKLAPSQWEMALLCNDISHWLGASLESALLPKTYYDYWSVYVPWSRTMVGKYTCTSATVNLGLAAHKPLGLIQRYDLSHMECKFYWCSGWMRDLEIFRGCKVHWNFYWN